MRVISTRREIEITGIAGMEQRPFELTFLGIKVYPKVKH